MARTLTVRRSIVPLAERRKYFDRLPSRKAAYARANCRFWVFEETDLAGAFMEFIEAADGDTLSRALLAAQEPVVDAVRIYQEVEID